MNEMTSQFKWDNNTKGKKRGNCSLCTPCTLLCALLILYLTLLQLVSHPTPQQPSLPSLSSFSPSSFSTLLCHITSLLSLFSLRRTTHHPLFVSPENEIWHRHEGQPPIAYPAYYHFISTHLILYLSDILRAYR
jgi:hypothetical protein